MNQNQEKTLFESFLNRIPERESGMDCSGLVGSEKAFLVSKIYKKHRMPVFIILSSPKDAERFMQDLRFFMEDFAEQIIYFPPYNLLPFKHLAYHNETAATRISTLFQLIEWSRPPIVVTTAEALIQKIIPRHEISGYAELLMEGEDVDRDLLIEKLIAGGYTRTVIVEEPGDFCIRGGIIDVFSPLYSEPLRVELYGDTVDSIRIFSASSQRKTKSIKEAVVLPAREAILEKGRIDQILNRVRRQASVLDMRVTAVREIVEQIKNEGVFPGLESLISMIYSKLETLFDYAPARSIFILDEPSGLERAAEKSWDQISRNFFKAMDEKRLCVEPSTQNLDWKEVFELLKGAKPLSLQMLPVTMGADDKDVLNVRYDFQVRDNNSMRGDIINQKNQELLFLPLKDWISKNLESQLQTILVCRTRAQAERLHALLLPYGIDTGLAAGFEDSLQDHNTIRLLIGQVSSGFVWSDQALALITEDEIFGPKHHRRRRPKQKIRTELIAFSDLKKEDLVVHTEHGIGQYEGLVKLNLGGTIGDFLLVRYKDEDRLYLPVDHMSKVQKYMGVDGITPVLDKMGGRSWEKVKSKVKKSVEKMAGELLKLYATRKVDGGHAFGKPDSYFSDFETGFPYEETPDQLKAIDDVLGDMGEQTSMDRLVCGDVGYGKTEVALRAAFVAVNDGKQVAVLVPTTVLAQQHYETFLSRFERYPVNLACLSRFRTAKEQRVILQDLKAGKLDIVIGTHRLLSKDVVFKDLGLFVLDEEQRFGVRQKEKLKKIRSTVDVLSLTATPIPRTLHMSLMGVRDISVISTPPEHRQAIITYISEYDETIISEAIRKELDRGGQIFFIHNNIHNIWAMAKKLQELVPEVRLDVAHGRLNEDELEKVMLGFMNRETDMLVCTTIVESGLDIPSANTMLINRADRFGLAQMYQLRGRIGRAENQAYAYLFIPRESAMSKDARKRLKVLMEHSDLGSGFQIAMSDLKIRGGGTILGASQSGHIAAVGYDMFLQLMENAVSELKGEPVQEDLEPEINISMPAYINESYISDIDQRLLTYRRLARMKDLNEIADFKEELIDRFGALPLETGNLLLKIMLKVLSIKAGVKKLDMAGTKLLLSFSEIHQSNSFGIIDMITDNGNRYKFTPDHVFKARLSRENANSLLIQTKNILKEIAQRVNY